MNPTMLRGVMGCLLAMALLGGASARPHSAHPDDRQANELLRHHKHHHSVKEQLCGSRLSDALRSICAERGFDAFGAAASDCCVRGCSRTDLEKLCQPARSCGRLGPGKRTSRSRPNHKVQLCGRLLSDELQNICAGSGFRTPESVPGSASTLSGDKGVASVCCQEGCSRTYLELYCMACEGQEQPDQPADQPAYISDSQESSDEASNSASDPTLKPPATPGNVETTTKRSNDVRDETAPTDCFEQQPPKQPTVLGGNGHSNQVAIIEPQRMISVGRLDGPRGTPIHTRHHGPSYSSKSH